MTIRTCLCLLIRPAANGFGASDGQGAGRGTEVLLGYKKTGFGAGRWVGLGGHIEDGEEPAAAAIREVEEESGLIVAGPALTHMARLTFVFPYRPSWDQTADVFTATEFTGAASESDELVPRWFPAAAMPFDSMWDDARYWLPLVLSGRRVTATVTFAEDNATVGAIDPDLRTAALT